MDECYLILRGLNCGAKNKVLENKMEKGPLCSICKTELYETGRKHIIILKCEECGNDVEFYESYKSISPVICRSCTAKYPREEEEKPGLTQHFMSGTMIITAIICLIGGLAFSPLLIGGLCFFVLPTLLESVIYFV